MRHSDPKVFLVTIVASLVLLMGVGALFIRGTRGNRGEPKTAIFLAMPILCLYLLNALGLYPIGVARILLFLVPTIIILFVYGLQAISYGVSAVVAKVMKVKSSENVVNALGAFSFILFVSVLLLYMVAKGISPFFLHETIEDSENAVRYLSKNVVPRDTVYVHASMREQFKLYSRIIPVSSRKVVWGNISWPCCPRDVSLDEQEDASTILRAEMARSGVPRKERFFMASIYQSARLLAEKKRSGNL